MKKLMSWLLMAHVTMTIVMGQNNDNEKAWEYFLGNDLRLALVEFSKIANVNPTNHQAILMLALISGERDSPESALQHFARFASVAPDINPYFSAMFFEPAVGAGLRTKKKPNREKFLLSLLQNPNLTPTNRAVLNEMMGDHYRISTDLKKANGYFKQIGSVVNWQIVGPFYNEAGSGFETGYGPIKAGGPNEVFTSDLGAPVSWYRMLRTQHGRWLNMAHYFDTRNSIVYAQTYCRSNKDQEVVFRLGVSGSVRVWVNDKEVFREANERNNGIDSYRFTVKIKSGSNRVLIQLGSSRISDSNFMLRVTDKEGEIANDLVFSSIHETYTTDNSDWKSEQIPCETERYFVEKVEADTENPINYILLAKKYLMADKTNEAKKVINQALGRWPNSSYLLDQLLETHSRDGNETEQGLVRNKIKLVDPENPMVISYLFNEEMDNENYPEAESLVNRYEKVRGRNSTSLFWRVRLAAEQEVFKEMYSLIDEGYKKYPDDFQFVLYKHLVLKAERKSSKALSILKKALKQNFDPSLISIYGNYLISTGNFMRGIKELERLVEYNPSATGYIMNLGNIHKSAKYYFDALKYYNEAKALAPSEGDIHKALGDCYDVLGPKDLALENYRKAMEMNPSDFELKSKLRQMEGSKPIFDHFDKPDFNLLIKNAPQPSDYDGENSVILLQECQKVAYATAGQEEKHYYLVKILNTDGIDFWKEINIPRYGNQRLVVEKAEVIKKNGSTAKAETYENQLIFTALEVGDVVAFIFKLETSSYGKEASNFSDVFMLSSTVPTKEARYTILVESGLNFKYKLTNSSIAAKVEEVENFTKHTWERFDLPAIKSEVAMSPLIDVAETIHFSTFPDWNFVMNWFNAFSENQARPHYIVQEKVAELMAGKEGLSKLDKAKVIYNYVTSEIRYSYTTLRQSGFVPQRASNVISSMIGDCKDVTTLFIAMCNEVGIDASPVLINSRSEGSTMPLPSKNFDHVIARLEIDGELIYLELTSNHLPFAAMHPELLGAMALEVKKEKGIKNEPFALNPTNRLPNTIHRKSEVKMVGNKLEVELKTKRIGYPAASMRVDFQGVTHEEQRRLISTSIASSIPNIDLIDLKFDESLTDNRDVLSYQHKFVINNPVTRIAGMDLIKLPLTDANETGFLISDASRSFPLNLWYINQSDKFYEEMIVHIPEGKVLVEIPEEEVILNEFANYKLSFKLDGNRLIINREFAYKTDVISPEKYPEFRAFLMRLIDSDTKQIAFKNK